MRKQIINRVIMKYILLFTIFISFQELTTTITETVTPNVNERIVMLKREIAEQIAREKHKHRSHSHSLGHPPIDKSDAFTDDYEYFDMDNKPVTPIMDFDDRKQKDKYKMKQIKSTTTKTPQPSNVLRTFKAKKSMAPKPKDIFYRRIFDEKKMNTRLEWTQCQDLITPFIAGQKKDFNRAKRITSKDNVVLRLIQLLSVNTTGYTKEDIYSIMYQISNLQLRFFQWDVAAIKLLLNVVMRDRRQTMKGLKHGLKSIFAGWHLDIGNMTNLLKQSRIFRPPCLRTVDYGGSTKPPKSARLYKKSTTKKKCPPDMYDDEEDECVKITIKY